MAVKKPKNITHRINYHVNANKGELKVNFSPSLKRSKLHDHQILVNATLAGTDLALQMLLGTLPVLRPASEAESEVSIYVFKDEERDNKIYKQRKELYDKVKSTYNYLQGLYGEGKEVDLFNRFIDDHYPYSSIGFYVSNKNIQYLLKIWKAI